MTAFNNANIDAGTSIKGIAKLIREVGTAFGKAQTVAQDAGIAIVVHASRFNDCSKAAALVAALPPKMRPLMTNWFMTVSPIGVKHDAETDTYTARFIKKDSKAYKPFDIELAKALEWFTPVKKEQADAPVTAGIFDMLDKVKEYLERQAKEGALAKYVPDDHALITKAAAVLAEGVQELENRLRDSLAKAREAEGFEDAKAAAKEAVKSNKAAAIPGAKAPEAAAA